MKKEINKGTEQKIIEIATDIFAKKGFEGTSIREICKEADVNISMVSYYFGSKKELYEKIVNDIVLNVINYMKSQIGVVRIPENFCSLSGEERVQYLFKIIDLITDYFYSDKISQSAIMIIFREQMTSKGSLDAEGFRLFKKLLAAILNKDENDKELVFRTMTIMGQIHSARIFKQFALTTMDQSGYSKEDIQMLKQIIKSQVRAILNDLGAA